MPAAMAHRAVGQGCYQSAVNHPTSIGVRLGEPQSDDHGLVRPFRIQRLPGIGERALPEVAFETFGNIGVGSAHTKLACSNAPTISAMRVAFIAYKVLNNISASV